jgi:hypothetical protein
MTDNTDDDTLHRLATGPLGALPFKREPIFESGKTYRTRSGELVKITNDRDGTDWPIWGRRQDEIHRDLWQADGSFTVHMDAHELDLLPGAIEDEHPRTAARTRAEFDRGIAELPERYREVTAQQRRDENRSAEGIASGQNDGRTAIDDRAAVTIHTRIPQGYQIKEVIAECDGKPAFEAITGRFDATPDDDHEKRLAALEEAVKRIDALPLHNMLLRIETIEEFGRNTQERITAIHESLIERIDQAIKPIGTLQQSMIRLIGWARTRGFAYTGDGGGMLGPDYARKVACHPGSAGLSDEQLNPLNSRAKPKRTIKGGWVNVYLDEYGRASVGSLHPTKEGAVGLRSATETAPIIACIQIPDITEGEGL